MNKILLVEDDRNTLDGLAEILGMENYDVTKALDGHSAIRELRNTQFNVVVTDLLLPDFDAGSRDCPPDRGDHDDCLWVGEACRQCHEAGHI